MIEKYYIRKYGRRDLGTGCLVNLTDGGEGVSGLVCSTKQLETCRMNGLIQGAINRDNGHMAKIARSISKEDRLKNAAASIATNRSNQTNSFFDPELRLKTCVKGGHVQGRRNVENGHLQRIALLPRKKIRRIWITDGVNNKLLPASEDIPAGWHRGRKV
jgi:hypothetical protein